MSGEQPSETTGLLFSSITSRGGRSQRGGYSGLGPPPPTVHDVPRSAAGSRTSRGSLPKIPKKRKKKKRTTTLKQILEKPEPKFKLDKDSAMELEYQVQVNLTKHNIASTYFYTRQMVLFTIPQAVLTMFTSILAFLSSSELFSEYQRTVLATIVGSVSGIVVFIQTLNGVCTYGPRAAMHEGAAIDLRDLRDHIILIKFKLAKQDEMDDTSDEESVKEVAKELDDDDDGDDDGYQMSFANEDADAAAAEAASDDAAEDLLAPSDTNSIASYDHRSTSSARSKASSKRSGKSKASSKRSGKSKASSKRSVKSKASSKRSGRCKGGSKAASKDDDCESDTDSDTDSDSDGKKTGAGAGGERPSDDDNVFARLQQRYRQSLAGCKSSIPMRLSEAFSGMESNMMVMNTKDRKTYMMNIYGKNVVYDNLIFFKAFDLLSEKIINYWLYPLFLPNPTNITTHTMTELHEILDEYHAYWDRKERKYKREFVEEQKEDKELNKTGMMSDYSDYAGSE